MNQPKMKRVRGDGVTINLAHWPGPGRPILAVHGITANCRFWDLVANSLQNHYDVYAMDLRGRGLSDKPDTGYSLHQHVRDILRVLESLNQEKVILMGHSLGAFITLICAAEHPDKIEKAVLVDGGGDLSAEQFDKVFQGIKPALDRLTMRFPSTAAYLATMKAAPYMRPWNDTIETFYRYEIEDCAEGVKTNISPAHIQEESVNVRKVDCRNYYARIACRTLILRADRGLLSEDDILLPPDVIARMTAEIPDVERFDVAGTNHYGILLQPHQERDERLLAFLADD